MILIFIPCVDKSINQSVNWHLYYFIFPIKLQNYFLIIRDWLKYLSFPLKSLFNPNGRKMFWADDENEKMNILNPYIISFFCAVGSFILWVMCILVLNLHNVQYKVSFSKKITYQNSYITHSWIYKKCEMLFD